MAKYKRTIRFQYYQIKCERVKNTNSSPKIFDFAKWIDNIESNGLMMTAIDFNDAKARIETYKYNGENAIWGIRIMKLRDTNIPSKAKDKEEAKVIDLEDGEYLGEDIFMLFHPASGIALIQQNRLSLGISRIEEFLEETYNRFVPERDKIVVSIEAILDIEGKSRIKKSDFKYIELSFANINNFVENEERKALGAILAPFKSIYGVNGSIKISLGRSGFDTLNKREIMKLVREIGMPSNKRYVRTAKLKIKEEDDTDVELLDLFNDICSEFIEFNIDSHVGLVFTVVISNMVERFARRKNELQKFVNYK